MNINWWRVGYLTMRGIKFVIYLWICIAIGVILGLAMGVVLWCLVVFLVICAVVAAWRSLQAYLLVRADEKELADRC